VAEFRYVFTDTAFDGDIEFIVTTWNEDGDLISTSSTLQVID
jgi:hypothetical protein